MLLSCELRRPMEKRHPSISVARSRTPKTFMPSGDTAYHHGRLQCGETRGSLPTLVRSRGAGSDGESRLPVVWAPVLMQSVFEAVFRRWHSAFPARANAG